MATLLYLDDVQVFPDDLKSIKIVKENPYLTSSDSYTLDVTLPMSILENRVFFKNIDRMECSKAQNLSKCRLIVDNMVLISGSARITQVNKDEVKVQLLGGNSELNNATQNLYIDTSCYAEDFVTIPVYNETTEEVVNQMWYHEEDGQFHFAWMELFHANQPNLVSLVKSAVAVAGYTLARCDFDISPWNKLYIANTEVWSLESTTVPHWTIKDFLKEVCNFFNCIMRIDQAKSEISFIHIETFYRNAEIVDIIPVDEYQTDFDDEEKKTPMTSQNIAFSMSSSKAHDHDYIDKKTLSLIPIKECGTVQAAINMFASLPAEERRKYLYKTNVGYYAGGPRGLIKVGHFSDYIGNKESDNELTLKICPVAIRYTQEALFYSISEGHNDLPMSCWVPSIEGQEEKEQSSSEDALDIIEESGSGSDSSSQQKDRIEVFFMDDVMQYSVVQEGEREWTSVPFKMPFTDYEYRGGDNHSHWSLSLNPSAADCYLGQLHRTSIKINTKEKTTFKFLSDSIPDPTSVFNIRNKRYLCEKIETSIDYQGMSRLMTGYFYRIT